ncbi:hypothetical protein OH491_24500 [Termitidicoccus mucosus]|uniref:hypothetical protein n=1 Tax=Termitidicoccus mucosus TaxID=1184151 RepID=UPI0011AB4971
MRFLFFLLLSGVASATTLNDQFRAIADGADRVELTWRPELGVESAGIVPLKKVYTGTAIQTLLSKITFEDDLPKKPLPPLHPGTVTIPRGNCGCSGSHLLRFWAKERMFAEISFHHGTHFRSKELNRGSDATLTDESQQWLQSEADWSADLAKIEEIKNKKKRG